MALLSTAALLLPSLGPLLDHHFAERQPGHQHWYAGAAAPPHFHDFQRRHVHYDALYDGLYAPAGRGGNDVVSLTRNDGAGPGAADWAVPAPTPRLRLDGAASPLLPSGANYAAAKRGLTVPPALRPPIA